MAAHILTALEELKAEQCTVSAFRDALEFAQLGDCLEYDDWVLLYREQDDEQFRYLAVNMIPMYTRKWKELGKPETAEEWKTNRSKKGIS